MLLTCPPVVLNNMDSGLLLNTITGSEIQFADSNHRGIPAWLEGSEPGAFLFLSLSGQVNTGDINLFRLRLVLPGVLSLKLSSLLGRKKPSTTTRRQCQTFFRMSTSWG